MRTVRLGRAFDAVFIYDAVMYMSSERELRAALATVAAHLEPGGVALVAADATAETFRETTEHGSVEARTGVGRATSTGPPHDSTVSKPEAPATRAPGFTPASVCPAPVLPLDGPGGEAPDHVAQREHRDNELGDNGKHDACGHRAPLDLLEV